MSTKIEARNESATAVSMAVAVMLKPYQAQARAEKALDRVKSATWRSVQEAAACFDAAMSTADRTALSGELARQYKRFYSEASAKVAASQHAKAIHMIATGVTAKVGQEQWGADRFGSMDAYFKACKGERHQADAGNAPRAKGADTVGEGDTSAQEAADKPANALSTAGMSVELGAAFVRLIEAARKNPEVADAVLFMSNSPDHLPGFVEYVIEARKEKIAGKLGEKFGADKVKRAA